MEPSPLELTGEALEYAQRYKCLSDTTMTYSMANAKVDEAKLALSRYEEFVLREQQLCIDAGIESDPELLDPRSREINKAREQIQAAMVLLELE